MNSVASALAGERSRARGTPALLIVWGAWLVVMTGANLAAPLYATYAARYGFSSVVLTAIFATYAFTLVPSLILFGRLSDRFGRRPVMVAGLAVACGGLALFAAAGGTAWLFAARALQGLAVGMIGGPATAALVEFDERHALQRPALLAGLAQAGGSGAGPLIGGAFAQWGPAPRQFCFLVVLGVTVAAGLLLASHVPESGRRGETWRIQWPRVPRAMRSDFARVSLTAAVLWAAAAMYLSIVPSYSAKLLHTSDLALLGAISAVALAASCAVQIASQRRRVPTRLAQKLGLGVLAAGLVALAAAGPAHSLVVLIAGALATGLGHGAGILGAQDELNTLAPDERRGEVTAAFIACIYALVAVAVVSSGLLALGISLSDAVGIVALALAAIAVAAAGWQASAR
ncbi:MAG TPA: MFS transporter [Solirubrobacteraceae bacterium]|nr:MFS transporter [Solirubrobacteraceae bacterium]